MISAIIYTSNTGFTKEYANLLSKKTGLPAYSADAIPPPQRREVIYLGWVSAGSIVGYNKAAKTQDIRAVCAVGMSPPTPELAAGFRKKHDINAEVFCLRGGVALDKLGGVQRLIMKTVTKKIAGDLEKLSDLTTEQQATLDMIRNDTNYVNEENLRDVLAWFENTKQP